MRIACAAHFTHRAIDTAAVGHGMDASYIQKVVRDSLIGYARDSGLSPIDVVEAIHELNRIGVALHQIPPPR